MHEDECLTSGAAQAKVKAASPVERCVLERMLAKPTSLILAVPSRVSKTLGDFRSCTPEYASQDDDDDVVCRGSAVDCQAEHASQYAGR